MVRQSLGHYTIIRPIGSGGMGEVYAAEDPKLNRKVALKVLPEEMAAQPERVARFEREAKAVAGLDHPNIVTVHSVEEADGVRFITMQLVDGETLSDKIPKKGFSLEKFFDLAIPLADAISTAHEHGITHRDLKPANVMVTNEGRVKVLDFGLAKLREETAADGPTLDPNQPLTEEGKIVGTVAYMSPEQAEGKPVDHRSDIFSLGILLYEMATGERPFKGDTRISVISSIVKDTPTSVTELNTTLPRHFGRIIRRCLTKDVRGRYQTAADVRNELGELKRELSSGELESSAAGAQRASSGWGVARPWLVGALLVILIGVIDPFSLWRKGEARSGPDAIWSEHLPDTMYLWGGEGDEYRIGGDGPSRVSMAWSPDGTSFVYASTDGNTSRLDLRRLVGEPTPIPGTEGGSSPFFKPDGSELGFYHDGFLRAVPMGGGGASRDIHEIGETPPRGVHWAGGQIVYSTGREIQMVPEIGGTSQAITRRLPGESAHLQPQLLEGDVLLYTVRKGDRLYEIWAKRLGGGEAHFLIPGAGARYSPETGYLFFGIDGVLMAVEFEPRTLQVTLPAFQALPAKVMQATGAGNSSLNTAALQFALSASGSLLYVTGDTYRYMPQELFWVDQSGKQGPPLLTGHYFKQRLSPTDDRISVASGLPGEEILQVIILDGGAVRRMELETTQRTASPWHPDGEKLVVWSEHEDLPGLYSVVVETGILERLTSSKELQTPAHVSESGLLVFRQGRDIYTLALDQPGAEPKRLAEGVWPTLSRDGKWVAYGRRRNDQSEIYVKSTDGGPEHPVTNERGGTRPVFSRTTDELFYRAGKTESYRPGAESQSSEMHVVTYEVTDGGIKFPNSPRALWLEKPFAHTSAVRDYDIGLDGRFLMSEVFEHQTARVTELSVILNWRIK